MPNIKSAVKRVSVNQNKAQVNKQKKSELKTAVKNAERALESSADNMEDVLKDTQAKIDRAVVQGLIHQNKAAHMKSQLAKKQNEAAK